MNEQPNRLVETQDKIWEYLQQCGIASRDELLRKHYRLITDEELTAILLVLTRTGLVREIKQDGKLKFESVI